MFKKIGTPESTISVNDGKTTKARCECGEMVEVSMTKKAFVSGETPKTACPKCGAKI